MFNKIKGLFESEAKIGEVHEKLSSQNESLKQQAEIIQGMHSDISNIKSNMDAFHSQSNEHLALLKQDMTEIKQIKDLLKSELDEMKLLKTHIKQKLVEDLTRDFKSELQTHVERIKTDVKSYNDSKQSLQAITLRLEQLKVEMEKFTRIASFVKENDFEMDKYAKRLKEFSDEKHELMLKIDALERLIGKERRRQF